MPKSQTPVPDALLHPIRWRIAQRALGREVTTTALKQDLPDVPTTTLYRHVATLIDAGYLTVVRERKVRGTTERTLTLNQPTYSQQLIYADPTELTNLRETINALLGPHRQQRPGKTRVLMSLIALPDD
ncbi:hypothetical protein [Kribbella sp. NPDC050470]|uniref:hypothetical protein n=1 Tax=unclassified Kribbella TaxID=2644121 RepID=UPI0037B1FD4B